VKKIAAIILACSFLAGCATYKFAPGKDPYDKGYVASRDGYAIPEYTVGKDNGVPDNLALAKERFKRRRTMVEYYYKKMGYIENRFREQVWDRGALMLKFMAAPLRLPFVAVDNYRYEHNSDYRRRVQEKQDEGDLKEEVRVSKIKETLKQYILQDMAHEDGLPVPIEKSVKKARPGIKKVAKKAVKKTKQKESVRDIVSPAAAEERSVSTPALAPVAGTKTPEAVQENTVTPALPAALDETRAPDLVQETPAVSAPEPAAAENKAPVVQQGSVATPSAPVQTPAPLAKPVKTKKAIQQESRKVSRQPGNITAIISAHPITGASPLKVRFRGDASRSDLGRIISYEWDFGDGDTSVLRNPSNTYWSTLFGIKTFTVILTVRDDAGNVATATQAIDVINN